MLLLQTCLQVLWVVHVTASSIRKPCGEHGPEDLGDDEKFGSP